ncbi:MAG: hypothetical protein ABI723_05315 [Bacteroidia bacterium]
MTIAKYKVEVDDTAKIAFQTLSDDSRKTVESALDNLDNFKNPLHEEKFQLLSSNKSKRIYSLKAGIFRVIFEFRNDTFRILDIINKNFANSLVGK